MKQLLQNKTVQTIFLFTGCFFLQTAFAAGGLGNLNKATDALKEIKFWLFAFVGLAAIVYLLYCIAMTFAERKSWSDVGMALIYCCLAGGAILGGNWALALFDGATAP